ncbi:MAG: helix-hairpin-helix domain-containing protein [Actinomycetota bacterium]
MGELFSPEQQGWRARLSRVMDFRPRELAALAILVLVIVSAGVFAFIRALPHAQAVPSAPTDISIASASLTAAPSVDPSIAPSGKIFVQVAGAVLHPGVYQFDAGARVIDALQAAGGPTKNGDPNSINLARVLVDGERIYVPRIGEQPSLEPQAPPTDSSSSGSKKGKAGPGTKVNINTASVNELETLPGIGPSLAQRIVDYRTQHGPFQTIDDLKKVHGIGPKKFDSLKDYITV